MQENTPPQDLIPTLDLSGQDDAGDQSALTEAHIEEIASVQEPDPEPGKAPEDSILEEADDE